MFKFTGKHQAMKLAFRTSVNVLPSGRSLSPRERLDNDSRLPSPNAVSKPDSFVQFFAYYYSFKVLIHSFTYTMIFKLFQIYLIT